MERVTLWTRQDKRSFEVLQSTGVFRVKKSYILEQLDDIAPHYLQAYQWLVEAMEKKSPRPDGVQYPIWCSPSDKNRLRKIPGTVVYCLAVYPKEAVFFDGAKWDYVLNHQYLPENQDDEKNYHDHLIAKGLEKISSFLQDPYARFYPDEKKKVQDSWDRIFSLKDGNEFSIQANIWEIRTDMLVSIE